MQHSVTTLNTKRTLAASLKALMEKKPLSKITVTELIRSCGVNRNTFYYHFQDIYALFTWMLEQETIEVIKQSDLLSNYEETVLFIIDYVVKNRHILSCAYDSMGREGMKRFLRDDFIGTIRSVIEAEEKRLKLSVSIGFRDILCEFYTEAFAGMIINWCLTNDEIYQKDRDALAADMLLLFRSSLSGILMAKAASNIHQEV